jgi:ubiquitin thioesterase OTU1
VNLNIRGPSGVIQVRDFKSTDTLGKLLEFLESKTKIPAAQQQLLCGFPPKPITSNLNQNLESANIKNGDQIILKQAGTQQGIVKGVDEGPYIPPSDGKGHFVRRKMPGDNSCLFHSLAYVLEGKSKTKGAELRKLVAQLIAENPKTYSEAVLGMPTWEYVQMIQDPDYWGGYVDLIALSNQYKVEIVSFDTQTCREDVYGQDKNYSRRAFIIYTGAHYDALALAEHGGASEDKDQVLFNNRDKLVLEKARAYVKEEHEKWLKQNK